MCPLCWCRPPDVRWSDYRCFGCVHCDPRAKNVFCATRPSSIWLSSKMHVYTHTNTCWARKKKSSRQAINIRIRVSFNNPAVRMNNTTVGLYIYQPDQQLSSRIPKPKRIASLSSWHSRVHGVCWIVSISHPTMDVSPKARNTLGARIFTTTHICTPHRLLGAALILIFQFEIESHAGAYLQGKIMVEHVTAICILCYENDVWPNVLTPTPRHTEKGQRIRTRIVRTGCDHYSSCVCVSHISFRTTHTTVCPVVLVGPLLRATKCHTHAFTRTTHMYALYSNKLE